MKSEPKQALQFLQRQFELSAAVSDLRWFAIIVHSRNTATEAAFATFRRKSMWSPSMLAVFQGVGDSLIDGNWDSEAQPIFGIDGDGGWGVVHVIAGPATDFVHVARRFSELASLTLRELYRVAPLAMQYLQHSLNLGPSNFLIVLATAYAEMFTQNPVLMTGGGVCQIVRSGDAWRLRIGDMIEEELPTNPSRAAINSEAVRRPPKRAQRGGEHQNWQLLSEALKLSPVGAELLVCNAFMACAYLLERVCEDGFNVSTFLRSAIPGSPGDDAGGPIPPSVRRARARVHDGIILQAVDAQPRAFTILHRRCMKPGGPEMDRGTFARSLKRLVAEQKIIKLPNGTYRVRPQPY